MRRVFSLVAAAVLSVCICMAACSCSSDSATVMRVGDEKLSLLDFRIYYNMYVANFYSTFSQTYEQMGIDPSVSYSEQTCYFDESKTWADFFVENTIDYCRELLTFLQQAEQEDVSLTDEERGAVEQRFEELADSLRSDGEDVQQYIEDAYGRGASMDDVVRIMQDVALYSKMYVHVTDSFGYEQSHYDEYYDTHKDQIDTVTVRMASFIYSDAGMSKEQAAEAAEAFDAAATDEDEFERLYEQSLSDELRAYFEGTDPTLIYNVSGDYFDSAELNEWLFSSSRSYWDGYVCDLDGMYAVFRFVEKDTKDYRLADIRHILVSDSSADGADTVAEIYSLLSEQDFDEEVFAQYALAYSDDSTTSTAGGLIENVYKGRLANAVTEWCFGTEHEAGDCGVVRSEYGYHILLFLDYGETYRTYLCRTAMESAAYDRLYSRLNGVYELEVDEEAVYSVVE